ncbi:MAG: diguanylate cyclase [Oscillospiraceae bacterium]|nr:diguanylate cyclase [Oscillospiraceae bacterium]
MKKSTMKYGLIIVLVIFALVPAIILGVVGTLAASGYSNDAKQEEFNTVTMSKAGTVGTVFSGYLGDAAMLSKLDEVVEAAKTGGDGASSVMKAYAQSNPDIADALVLNASGTVVTSAAGAVNGTFEHFDKISASEVSTLLSWDKYQTDGFFVSREINNGSVVGYVCLVVAPTAESSISQALAGTYINGKARLALIDSDGNTINFEGNGASMKVGQLDGAISGKRGDFFKNTVSNVTANDNRVIGTAGKYNYISGVIPEVTSWRWLAVCESSEFGSAASPIMPLIVLAIAALIMSALGVLIITKFVGKMHGMLKTMDSITHEDGISSTRFDVKRKEEKSELGAIQTSFNEFLDEVRINSDRYRTIANLSDNMLFEWDFHKEIMYISDNMLQKFDLKAEGATLSNGRFLDSLMTPEDADKYKRDISSMLKNQKGYNTQYHLMTKSGTPIWVSFRANCITDRVGEPLRVIGVLTDIDNEKKAEMQLSERASIDFLSQLYNRSTFIRMLTQELDRRGPNKVATMFIDVDDFKFINDRYGHSSGDEAIRFVADNIRKKVDGRGGFAGRFGGDEFVLCYTNQEDIANLEQIAMDIIDELYVGFSTNDGTLINVRVSIGISYCPQHTEDVNELLSYSDTAMYFVKKNGKTNYHIYMPEDSESGEYIDPEGYQAT